MMLFTLMLSLATPTADAGMTKQPKSAVAVEEVEASTTGVCDDEEAEKDDDSTETTKLDCDIEQRIEYANVCLRREFCDGFNRHRSIIGTDSEANNIIPPNELFIESISGVNIDAFVIGDLEAGTLSFAYDEAHAEAVAGGEALPFAVMVLPSLEAGVNVEVENLGFGVQIAVHDFATGNAFAVTEGQIAHGY